MIGQSELEQKHRKAAAAAQCQGNSLGGSLNFEAEMSPQGRLRGDAVRNQPKVGWRLQSEMTFLRIVISL
jgi:hypothetical protein